MVAKISPNTPSLSRDFYRREVAIVARELLGKLLLRATRGGLVGGRIVEVEAYLAQGDTACHAHRGRTPRNAAMFGPPGRAYVYSIHARHCFNAVTEEKGIASAVLIRSIEPLAGLAPMRSRRATEKTLDLARGPGRLCQALEIDKRLNCWDLTRGRRLWISTDESFSPAASVILQTPRVGVTSARVLPLRFCFADSPYVSGPRQWRTG